MTSLITYFHYTNVFYSPVGGSVHLFQFNARTYVSPFVKTLMSYSPFNTAFASFDNTTLSIYQYQYHSPASGRKVLLIYKTALDMTMICGLLDVQTFPKINIKPRIS